MSGRKSIFVGIAGGSGSGKSFLARLLSTHFTPQKVASLSVDQYYLNQGHLSDWDRARVNYDAPEVLDFSLLVEQLRRLRTGEPIGAPIYDFTTHTRKAETVRLEQRPLVVVEGILALHPPELRSMFDLTIFVDTPTEVRFNRRLERDIRERGRTAYSVRQQWLTSVLPMHERFCAPSAQFANIVVQNSKEETKQFEPILNKIRTLISTLPV